MIPSAGASYGSDTVRRHAAQPTGVNLTEPGLRSGCSLQGGARPSGRRAGAEGAGRKVTGEEGGGGHSDESIMKTQATGAGGEGMHNVMKALRSWALEFT